MRFTSAATTWTAHSCSCKLDCGTHQSDPDHRRIRQVLRVPVEGFQVDQPAPAFPEVERNNVSVKISFRSSLWCRSMCFATLRAPSARQDDLCALAPTARRNPHLTSSSAQNVAIRRLRLHESPCVRRRLPSSSMASGNRLRQMQIQLVRRAQGFDRSMRWNKADILNVYW